MNKIFGLIDCNNFFATCERVFNPKIINKPVAVLSNNDGCIIARSNEVKALGIPMGAPLHLWKDVIERNGVKVFSANFELYGDISTRVMNTIKDHCTEVEIYSIDEAFMNLTNMHIKDYKEYGKELRKKILKYTSITTSIGIASTKTLSKIANRMAKDNDGVMVLLDSQIIDKHLKHFEVGQIWGVGYNLSELFRKNGIYTAYDLKKADDRWAKDNISVMGQRLVLELRGIPCYGLEDNHAPKKGIMSSRSFSKQVYDFNELKEAVASFTSRAAAKLRSQKSLASLITVSLKTSKYAKKHYYNNASVSLSNPSSYTPDLVKHAFLALEKCYNSEFAYKKTSVYLSGIVPEDCMQPNLFNPEYDIKKYNKAMEALDKINYSFGRNAMRVGATGTTQPWKGKRELASPRYTTHWDEILTI